MDINKFFAKGHTLYTFLYVMGKSEWENRFERELKKKTNTHTKDEVGMQWLRK